MSDGDKLSAPDHLTLQPHSTGHDTQKLLLLLLTVKCQGWITKQGPG